MNQKQVSTQHEKLFAALQPSLRVLARRGVVRSYRKGGVIINEGEQGDAIFIVLEGRVRAFANDEHGRELTYGLIGAGDYFGEMSLDGGPRSASIEAVEPTLCSVVSRVSVREHLAEEPEFALEIVAQVIRRARQATDTARRMALMDVYGRVVHLLEESGPAAPTAPIKLTKLTHQAIASRVGASREMVSRILKELEHGGHLELGVKTITVKSKLPARW